MGLIAKNKGGGSFTPCPAGTHIARCVSIIDIGMQHSEYQGKPTSREQIIIGWEVPEERVQTEDGDKPAFASEFFTNSLNEKAKLRHVLESWRGRAFTEAELEGFDLQAILDKPCQLTVIHEAKADGGVKAKISGVTPLHKSMTCPPRENPLVVFDIDNPDMKLFDSFSDGMKKLIEKSDQWKARTARGGRPPMSEPGAFDIPADDDIPF